MKPFFAILLIFAVVAVAGTEVINVSLPDRDAPDTVLGTVESVWEFVTWLVQIGDDLMSFVHDVLGYLEVGGEYIERLMGAMDLGRDLVNKTLEENAPSRGL
jgi:hypothetical protein